MKSIMWRSVMIVVFTAVALLLFLPSTPLSKRLPAVWADNVPKMVLGLDLQGGMHLVLDVQQEKAVENYTQRLSGSMETSLKTKGVLYTSVTRTGVDSIDVAYATEEAASAIKKLASEEYPALSVSETKGGRIFFKLKTDEIKRIKEWATTQALETIRNRIDKFGVSEPLIQRQGDREIVVELPGLKDTERAISLIGKTAVLEFRLVDEANDPSKGVPFGSEVIYGKQVDSATGAVTEIPYIVKKEVLLTGDLLSDARVAFNPQFNEPYVSLTFDSTGARVFARITEKNVNKRLAIILDGNVHSAPVIREKIAGGSAQISGGFTNEEAADLAIVLRAGALPAPVTIVQNVTVGPSLGRDSIEAGIKAGIVGAALVLVFMLVYYKTSGLIADVAVFLNIVMLLGVMAYFNSTLTLPGIAGIVLTIGMGVDSNVLIFERIKEELLAGRTAHSAIQAGYDRAWWTVVDSHVTTLITAAVLFQFGSGPIKGFAVTLSMGIFINLFTALVGTKLVFDIRSEKFGIKKISI
ncbi:MAG: protein translocase subunit SecD [Deltaproteobacteria bacterium]